MTADQNPEKRKPRRAHPLQIIIGYLIGMSMVLAGVYFSSLTPVGPLPEALPYMQSTGNYSVEVTPRFVWFRPLKQTACTGVILYPGGRVDYRSYAPLAARLAEKGWPVAIARMPFNLAVFSPDRAADVINAHPEISTWVIGGHSLGGTMAARFTLENPGGIAGIIFLASYPADDRLSSGSIPVLSIYASGDGLITLQDWEKYRPRFPADTEWVEITGGNHAGFGWYGDQEGDNPAGISLDRQTDRVMQAIDQFLIRIENAS